MPGILLSINNDIVIIKSLLYDDGFLSGVGAGGIEICQNIWFK